MGKIGAWIGLASWGVGLVGFTGVWLALGGVVSELDRWWLRCLAWLAPLVGLALGRRIYLPLRALLGCAIVAWLMTRWLTELRSAQLLVGLIGLAAGAHLRGTLWPALNRSDVPARRP